MKEGCPASTPNIPQSPLVSIDRNMAPGCSTNPALGHVLTAPVNKLAHLNVQMEPLEVVLH